MKRKHIFLAGAVAATAAIALFALPYHPAYQEWQCRHKTLEQLQSLQKRLPESPIVLYYVGRALLQESRSGEALPLLQQAAALDADTPRLREALVKAQMAQGKTRDAFDGLKRFLEVHPDEPAAYRMLGRFYLGVQSLSRALVVLEEAVKRFPNNASLWALLASAYDETQNRSGAKEAVAKAVTLQPDEAEHWILQGRIQSDAAIAQSSYEKALQLTPDDLDLQAEYADFIARKGGASDRPKAEMMARRVLEAQPDNSKASAALGLILAEGNQPAEAMALLEKALRVNAQDIRLLTTLRRLAIRQGDAAQIKRWETALQRAQAFRAEQKRLLDVLERNPKDAGLQRQMGQLLGRNGQVATSLRYYGMALGMPSDAPATLCETARALQSGGFTLEARQLAERALQNGATGQEKEAAQELLNSLQ